MGWGFVMHKALSTAARLENRQVRLTNRSMICTLSAYRQLCRWCPDIGVASNRHNGSPLDPLGRPRSGSPHDGGSHARHE
jgi:hypothetical protein